MTTKKELEKNKRYYQRNKEKVLAQKKEYRAKNKERDLKRKKEYYQDNKERLCAYQEGYRKTDDYKIKHRVHCKNFKIRNRQAVLDHYGRVCACCGEKNEMFLVIDHVNGGGNQHRKEVGNVNAWLIKNNFPAGFQVLCMNCNLGRELNNGTCPHKG
jgi:hypothetical protein